MSQTKLLKKRVEILPSIQSAIQALVKMGETAAKLEYFLTEKDCDDLKRSLREFESDHYTPLKKLAADVKATYDFEFQQKVNERVYSKNKNKYINQKNKKHDTDEL